VLGARQPTLRVRRTSSRWIRDAGRDDQQRPVQRLGGPGGPVVPGPLPPPRCGTPDAAAADAPIDPGVPVPWPTALAVSEALAAPWARGLAERVPTGSDCRPTALRAGALDPVDEHFELDHGPRVLGGGTRLDRASPRPDGSPPPRLDTGQRLHRDRDYVETRGRCGSRSLLPLRHRLGSEELAAGNDRFACCDLRLKQYDEAMACFRHDRLAGNEFCAA